MYIYLKTLCANGIRWQLGERPLLIGRGHDCDIRVFDSELSRHHAKVWLESGVIHFKDLGSRNATLLNGRPSDAGTVVPGDTLGAGSTIFYFATSVADATVESTQHTGKTPITLSARLDSYIDGGNDGAILPVTHRTVHELHTLFQLARILGSVETTRELSELLYKELQARFEPDAIWIAWRYADTLPLVMDETNLYHEVEAPPLPLLEVASQRREGRLEYERSSKQQDTKRRAILVIPLIHADQLLGVFAVRGQSERPPYTPEHLHHAIGIAALVAPHVRAVRHAEQLRRDHDYLLARSMEAGTLLGSTLTMVHVREQIARAATSSLPVLFLGETGTGKEIAARMLHESSPRKEGPYVIVNCAAIPDHLFESEFFGHEQGAFTGATARRVGYFEEAHGGTLFLDEVGDLSAENQARILRAIESNSFRRVGGSITLRVDVRIVAATNRSLQAPGFRLDLLHRLNGITIIMPPLRSRSDDIPELVAHFLQSSPHKSLPGAYEIESDVVAFLQGHDWPGNVRELKALVERTMVFANDSMLRVNDFQSGLIAFAETGNTHVQSRDNCDTSRLLPLAEVERDHILRVLQACDGNIAEAARALKINRATLYRRLAEYVVS